MTPHLGTTKHDVERAAARQRLLVLTCDLLLWAFLLFVGNALYGEVARNWGF